MKRFITSLIALLSLQLALNAGNIVREEKFPSIAGISAGDNFNITIADGPAVTVKMTLEDVLADYVHLSLVDGILSIDYDEKSITKEVRAALSKREPKSIMMDVVISIPPSCAFSSIDIFKNATLTSTASFGTGNSFKVNAKDNAVIKSLTINSSEATLQLSKHSDTKASVSSAKTTVLCEGNCSCELNLSGKEARVECSGASMVTVHSSAGALSSYMSGSSKITMDGTAENLEAAGKNSSFLDATSLDAKTASVDVSNATCEVNAQEKLSITLSGGAKLYYCGAPAIEIGKVDRSSIYKKETEQQPSAESK